MQVELMDLDKKGQGDREALRVPQRSNNRRHIRHHESAGRQPAHPTACTSKHLRTGDAAVLGGGNGRDGRGDRAD